MHTAANYEPWFRSQKGFCTPPTQEWEKSSMWAEDPVMMPYRVAGRLGLTPGYSGPANRKAAEVLTKYIITDMYAKAIQGMAPEAAVKWANDELVKIYA
jgi:multiple sugar transport system substrate-binding protein